MAIRYQSSAEKSNRALKHAAVQILVNPTLFEHGLIFFLDQHYSFAHGLYFVGSIALSAILLGLCQPPSAMIWPASAGPQLRRL
jgi:hypothetical protein